MLEDDSDQDERDGDYADDDDRSSSLSIPNESIDFDLVYSLHSFAATVEGQASVVKGDSLVLMDDSNSYWWLVRVLKTQEIGYIPAENIETPFERLARLNKHRNVDVCSLRRLRLSADTCHHSSLPLPKRRRRMVVTSSITCPRVLVPVSKLHSLPPATLLPVHGNVHAAPSFLGLFCRFTVILLLCGEMKMKTMMMNGMSAAMKTRILP